MTVFRGSVNRVVHAVELRATDASQGIFVVNGLSTPRVFDPVGVVLAEPELVMQRESKHGLTLQLSPAARHGIEILQHVAHPKLPKPSAADDPEEAAGGTNASSSQSEGLQFTDRSFTKTNLRKSVDQFWPALARAYAQEGQPFVDANDFVQLGEQKLSFKDLANRSATFLEKSSRAHGAGPSARECIPSCRPCCRSAAQMAPCPRSVSRTDFLQKVVPATSAAFSLPG
ncbi:unnamed protein product [Symbiodinium necroappetens]|uniref:Uncharacterized protein n=1 Tax=Symbiodinium necroappetens TaxID=1628268 RepID=A0A812TPG6_9DINO|nr:unnamed protein product [Symbiodinium necroappetens]